MASILLLEPDKILGQTYRDALTEQNYSVDWVRSSQTAIGACDKQTPDLVILELQLAMHNGVEFLYEFRSYKDLQTVPVIVISNVPPTLKAISTVLWDEVNIAAYHYKPLTRLTDLINSVDTVLNGAPILNGLTATT